MPYGDQLLSSSFAKGRESCLGGYPQASRSTHDTRVMNGSLMNDSGNRCGEISKSADRGTAILALDNGLEELAGLVYPAFCHD